MAGAHSAMVVVVAMAAMWLGRASAGFAAWEPESAGCCGARRVGAQQVGVEYVVHLDRPQTQTLRVDAIVRDWREDTLDVVMPAWRPGRYVMLDFAGTVRTAEARDGSGRALPMAKVRTSAWRIETGGAREVRFSYEVYANSLSDRTRHVDDTHAFLSPSSVLVMVPARREMAATVRLEMPATWRVSSGLPAEPGSNGRVLRASSYDELADSPIEAGAHERAEFEAMGKQHEFVIWGMEGAEARRALERLVPDTRRIVEYQGGLFGALPYERYVFMLHVGPGLGGGTEHVNSTIMQTQPGFLSAGRYEGLLSLISHEFFHTWNVKQFRPAGLVPYEYEAPNLTDMLWIVEGTTSYYDDLTLARTGQIGGEEYLGALAGAIGQVRATPGQRVQSLSDSSTDAWVKFNRPTADSVNTSVSFYTKGALVSLLLDLELRRATGDARSMDDVMRELSRRFGGVRRGYTEADVRAIVAELAGRPMDSFFDVFVRQPTDLPLEAALEHVGLMLVREPVGEGEARSDVGLELRAAGEHAVVRAVRSDGPGFEAGFNEGDRLVSVGGTLVSASTARDVLASLEPDVPVEIAVVRRERMRTIGVTPTARAGGAWRLERAEQPTQAQQRALAAWLGQSAAADLLGGAGEPGLAMLSEQTVATLIDAWHASASRADGAAYFGAMAEDAIFLGTDATEHWTKEQFQALYGPYMASGKGWTFVPTQRVIRLGGDGTWAWFDELLSSEHLGQCRGSGVVVLRDGRALVQQYNLSIPIPNALADEVVERVREHGTGEGGGEGR